MSNIPTQEEVNKALNESVEKGELLKFVRNGEIYYQEPATYEAEKNDQVVFPSVPNKE